MIVRTLIVSLLCLLTGLVVGRFSVPHQENVQTTLQTNRSASEGTLSVRQSLARASESSNSTAYTEAAKQLEEISGMVQSEETGSLVVVPVRFIECLRASNNGHRVVDDLFSARPEAQQALHISDVEKAKVQSAWRTLKQQIYNLEKSNVRATDLEDGSVQITIAERLSGVQTIAEHFRSHTQKVLGVNRTEAFLAMQHFDSIVANVAAEQELHIKMDAMGDGQWRYKISQKSEGDLKSVVVARAIPRHLRHITESLGIQTSLGVLNDEESE